MGNCSDQDRLSSEWQEAVVKFADAVARLPNVEDADFWERYEKSRAAGGYAENAFSTLELHRQFHQCKPAELSATKPPEPSTVSVPFLLLRPSAPHGRWQLHDVHCWRSRRFDPDNVQIIESTNPVAWIEGELKRNHGTDRSAGFRIMPCLRLQLLVDVFKG